ncbi:unnamed protein product, partial [Mesorhabditis spiculigera]
MLKRKSQEINQIVFANKALSLCSQIYPLASLVINLVTFAKLAWIRWKKAKIPNGRSAEINLIMINMATLVMQLILMGAVIAMSRIAMDAGMRTFMVSFYGIRNIRAL